MSEFRRYWLGPTQVARRGSSIANVAERVYLASQSRYIACEDSNLHLHRRRSGALSMFRTEDSAEEGDFHAGRTLQCLQCTLTRPLKAEMLQSN